MARKWNFYRSPAGREKVADDIRSARLTLGETARLELLLERIARGNIYPKDVKTLRDGVLEARLDGQHRIFRLAYAEVEGGLVLLALHFFEKKRKIEPKAIQLAVDRLQEWKRRVET